MIECLSMFYQNKPATQISQVNHPANPRNIIKSLSLAFNEWLLMFMLFLNSIFAYMIKTFADYSQLQSPCLMCSRLDHILGKKCLKPHWDMICAKHKSEISSLVYCHAHGNLVDVRGMCESCLFSFATTNKSNAETYRLLVGKLGEDSCFGSSSDTNPRLCTCCNQILMPRGSNQVPESKVWSKTGLVEKKGILARDIRKKNVKFNNLPHVGYSELKIYSDTESEALFSEDEESRIHKFRTRHLETPVITLPYDLATDKLLNPYFPLQSLVPHSTAMADIRGNELEQDQDQELIPFDDVVETSDKVLINDKEIISLDDLFPTSAAMVNEREMIPFLDISLKPDLQEHSADDLSRLDTERTPVTGLMENELICLNDDPETQGDILNKIELISLHEIPPSLKKRQENSRTVSLDEMIPESITTNESFVEILKETKLISLDEIPPSLENRQENNGIVSLDEIPESLTANESFVEILKETELISLDDIPVRSESQQNNSGILSLDEIPESFTTNGSFLEILKETELISLDEIPARSEIQENNSGVISLDEVLQSITANESSVEVLKESVTDKVDISSLDSEKIISSSKDMTEISTQNCEPENLETKETPVAENKDFHLVKDEDYTIKITSAVSAISEMVLPAIPPHTETALESQSSSFDSMSVAAETNTYSTISMMQETGLLDLTDAYNIIVSNEEKNQESNGDEIEQWIKKDTSRVSEDLKALLTQISASRGIEFLSSRDISPKISVNSDESKNIDHDMQLLLQKRMLDRNESNLSLEEVAVSEIEGENETDRLKRQVDHDKKLLTGLYKELEEERSASAIATNQAMAMITRLQEEKALFQMEALQNLRMMEEQAEYDMEAIQKLNDLLVEREKLIQDLEAEIEYYRDQTPQAKASSIKQESSSRVEEKASEIDSPSKRISNRIQSSLMGFNEERLYITNCLEKIENKLQGLTIDEIHENGEANVPKTEESVSSKGKDGVSVEDEVYELHERVEKLKGDLYFLEHVVNSLEHGDEGVQFVKEIASHLQTLRSLSMGRHHHHIDT